MIDDVLKQADQGIDASVNRLFELLRIPSVSTDPAFAENCKAAADWLVAELSALGFDASRRDTTGHPMVVAHHRGEGPHLLFYGHYDVQPADPLELWDRDPFDPALEDTPQGKVIRARGASDDKGQLMTFVEAFRAFKAATGTLPGNITLLFEGEEETGSPSLIPFLKDNAEELRADLAMICDTGMFDAETPAITTLLRGLVGEEFTIHAADRDLHSGIYGGPAINPIRVLTKLLAGLHDDDGRITLPGFYEGVPDLPDEIRASWAALGFDEKGFLGEVGLSALAGETGFSALEQIWARPTCDVNGIWGGYTGAGFKTVLPAEASAKVSFRLVGDQDAEAIQQSFRDYIQSNIPEDCTVSFRSKDASGATTLPYDAPEFGKAQDALTEEWDKQAVFVGCGGSIPIVGHFRTYLGMESMMIGFSLDSDNIHSPNEQYDLRSFHKGIRSWIRIIDKLTS